MMNFIFTFPELPDWAQQLASILPFTALVEFIDLPSKLHVFELAGHVPLWNWPVTPAGARLLLSTLDNSTTCCLDREERSIVLHCMDGRYGDCYPCNTPTTTRLAAASGDALANTKKAVVLPNASANMNDNSVRRQQLTVVLLDQSDDEIGPLMKRQSAMRVVRRTKTWAQIKSRSDRYRAFSWCGWLLLLSLIVLCALSGHYVALAYLCLMPSTGAVIQVTHGGGRRELVDGAPSEHKRMVFCTSSFNGNQWWAFVGGSRMVNSLLNKPLFRTKPIPSRPYWAWLLQILIAGQWATALASCALIDWNAIIISLWIIMCALTSGYLIQAGQCAQDWLRRDCKIKTTYITTTFSSRRSMLSAMVYLNPDTKERRTDWMNPILAPCQDRTEWESALLTSIENNGFMSDQAKSQYWAKFIAEGLAVGKMFEEAILCEKKKADSNKTHDLGAEGKEAKTGETGVQKV